MNKIYLIILFLEMCFGIYSQSHESDPNKFIVEINILDAQSKKEIVESDIIIYSKDEIINHLKRNDSLPLILNLKYNNQYKILIKSKDYINAFIDINYNDSIKPFKAIETIYLSKQRTTIDFIEDFTRLNFTLNNFKLNNINKSKLDSLINVLNNNKIIMTLEIGGHCSFFENENLDSKRANTVKKYLIENGIDPNRLVLKPYGTSVHKFSMNELKEIKSKEKQLKFDQTNCLITFSVISFDETKE